MMRALVAATAACLLMSSASASEEDVRDTLAAFIAAFEAGDTDAMRAAFADDAVTFPRAIMAVGLEGPLNAADYRRVRGIDPQMLAVIAALKSRKDGPPYLDIRPKDLDIRVFGDAALATFHLGDDDTLGRRTFVLSKYGRDWKIVHLHASNVESSGG